MRMPRHPSALLQKLDLQGSRLESGLPAEASALGRLSGLVPRRCSLPESKAQLVRRLRGARSAPAARLPHMIVFAASTSAHAGCCCLHCLCRLLLTAPFAPPSCAHAQEAGLAVLPAPPAGRAGQLAAAGCASCRRRWQPCRPQDAAAGAQPPCRLHEPAWGPWLSRLAHPCACITFAHMACTAAPAHQKQATSPSRPLSAAPIDTWLHCQTRATVIGTPAVDTSV